MQFNIEIQNVGTAASPNTKHGVLLTFSNGRRDTLPWSDSFWTGLGVNETRTQGTNSSPKAHGSCPSDNGKWLAVSGTYTIEAWVDDTNSSNEPIGYVKELSENNNRKSFTITIP